jgi:putative glutamine amidotransferase
LLSLATVGPEGKPAALIGITASEVHGPGRGELVRYGEPAMAEMTLGLSYARAVQRAGGLAVVIPPLPVEATAALVDRLDGIVLSGGPDIHPGAYGEAPHHELGPTWRELDVAQLAIAGAAVDRGTPLLGISRGAQALNIARGGTLYQHLPEQFGRSLHHLPPGGGRVGFHEVRIEPSSRLYASLGEVTSLEVSSYHHQAASGLGRGVRAVAWAPDGVVEAIEVPDAPFAIGVQWHAEAMLESSSQLRLFGALVRAAAERAAGARPALAERSATRFAVIR